MVAPLIVGAGLAYGASKLFGDDERDPQMPNAKWNRRPRRISDKDLLRQWEFSSEAGTLGGMPGSTQAASRAQQLLAEIERRGLSTEGIDVRDFSTGRFNASEAQDALTALTQQARRPLGDPDRMNRIRVTNENKLATLMAERNAEENERWVNENIDPTFDLAQRRMEELAGTNAISATQEAALRTRIAERVKLGEEGQLRRAASVLGLRGLDPSSPAGAALAARAAERADAQLSDALRELGIDVTQLNREQARFDAAAATQIATGRLAAHTSIMGDQRALVDMQKEVAALIDTMYARDRAFNMMEQSLDSDDGGGYGGIIGTVGGAALGSIIPGVGTAIGAGLGGAIGSAFDGSQNPGSGLMNPGMLQYLSSLGKQGPTSSYGQQYQNPYQGQYGYRPPTLFM